MAEPSDCLIEHSEQRPALEYARVSEFLDALKAFGAQISSAISVRLRSCHGEAAPPPGILCWSYLCASAALRDGGLLELKHFCGAVQCLDGEQPPEPIQLYALLAEVKQACQQLGLELLYCVQR